jgi:hypothetical protein
MNMSKNVNIAHVLYRSVLACRTHIAPLVGVKADEDGQLKKHPPDNADIDHTLEL